MTFPTLPPAVALLAALGALALPAFGEAAHPARLEPGDHVRLTHAWDADTDSWSPAGPEASTACFRVEAVSGTETTLVLIAGRYFTAWDGAEQEPGYRDTWRGTDEFYRAKHPQATGRELAQGQFTTVAGCAGS